MPSSKSPSALQIGSGKIPNNTVSNSALTSVPGNSVSVTPPPINVQTVTGAQAISRTGQIMVILVDATSGSYLLTLPTTAQVGDVIMFVTVSTTTSNVVSIGRGGGDTLQGSANSQALVGPFAARTVVRSTLTDWTFQMDMPTVQLVNTSLTLTRGGKKRIVLVDSTSGNVTLTLPQTAQIGDEITVIKTVAANTVTVDGNLGDTVDGRLTTAMRTALQTVALVRVASGAWASVSETTSVIEISDSFSLSNTESAKEIHILVHTLVGSWTGGTHTITLPNTAQLRLGTILTITDADGNANATNGSIIVTTGISGVTLPYSISRNFGSLVLIFRGTTWDILSEEFGQVEDFTTLSRLDNRADVANNRFQPLPMPNWSQRRVALHAEFNGLITNVLPVEGFTAGGAMSLSSAASASGTVGVLRTTTTAGSAGYLHLGSLPTDDIFLPAQLLGFRVILTPVTANLGTDYSIVVGFGDDISDSGGGQDQRFGTNSLYIRTSTTSGFWRRNRQNGGTATGTDSPFAYASGNRVVIEYYNDGTNWDMYFNGTRDVGGSSNKPTAMLNFGLQIAGAGLSNYVVDVDSFTIFTLDLGTTRHNP